MNNKIGIVVAYFGKFPNYFPLWLKSCGSNPTIDFIIVTDQDLKVKEDNVIVKRMTLLDMQVRASNVLGFDAKLSKPYKCCDYRPVYGLLFSDLLSKYDYWGHCDVDLIFGDLQYFFDKYDLYSYDKFGTLGHLSLYRNNEKMNNSFIKICEGLNYREVFSIENNCLFDELGGIYKIHKNMNVKLFTKRIFIDIATIYKRYRIIDVYKLDTPAENYPVQTFCWDNGKVFHVYESNGIIHKQEYIYIHFQKRPNFELSHESLSSDMFYITNKGFIPATKERLTGNEILKMNPYPGGLYEVLEGRYSMLKRRIYRYIKRKLSI